MSDRLKIIKQQLRRVDGEKLSLNLVKYQKMATGPFQFFRGSAQLFYRDIQTQLLNLPAALTNARQTTILGDCHLANFGFISEEGSHSDRIVFTANDFDDACFANPFWDLLRYCVSIHLAIAQARLTSSVENALTPHDANLLAKCFIDEYSSMLRAIIEIPHTRQCAIDSFNPESSLYKYYVKAVSRAVGGEHYPTKSALAKLIRFQGVKPIFNTDSNCLQPLADYERQVLTSVFLPYVDDAIIDCCARVEAGTGSINMQRYYLLVGPNNYQSEQDLNLCHIVEVKQQRVAAPLYYFPCLNPRNKLNPAHLTVVCQRLMQRNPDFVLDDVVWRDKHWLVRSRHHARVNIDVDELFSVKKKIDKTRLRAQEYVQACGRALALAHARADRRSTQFEQETSNLIAAHLPTLLTAAEGYAGQVMSDHSEFANWVARKSSE